MWTARRAVILCTIADEVVLEAEEDVSRQEEEHRVCAAGNERMKSTSSFHQSWGQKWARLMTLAT
jgi:hypothetical protein